MTEAEFSNAITAAIGAHGAWKARLKAAVVARATDVSIAQTRRDDCCDLGRILHQKLSPEQRAAQPIARVIGLHRQFHEAAGDALDRAVSGEAAAANAIIDGVFSECSAALKAALMDCKTGLRAR